MSRYIGKANVDNDIRNVVIILPFIQEDDNQPIESIDFQHSLVADIDTLNSDLSSQLEGIVRSEDANRAPKLIDFLSSKTFRNGDYVLNVLHSTRNLKKVPAESITFQFGDQTFTQAQINEDIRKIMTEQRDGKDVDAHRRETARQYQQELNPPPQYPEFDNPSDKGDVALSDIDENTLRKYNLQDGIPEQVTEEDVENHRIDEDVLQRHMPQNPARYDNELHSHAPESPAQYDNDLHKTAQLDSESAIKAHKEIMDNITTAQGKLNDMSQEAYSYIALLDQVNGGNLLGQMEEFSKSGQENVKDALIDMLASHYPNIDAAYIKKNLSSADKRLGKKSSK